MGVNIDLASYQIELADGVIPPAPTRPDVVSPAADQLRYDTHVGTKTPGRNPVAPGE